MLYYETNDLKEAKIEEASIQDSVEVGEDHTEADIEDLMVGFGMKEKEGKEEKEDIIEGEDIKEGEVREEKKEKEEKELKGEREQKEDKEREETTDKTNNNTENQGKTGSQEKEDKQVVWITGNSNRTDMNNKAIREANLRRGATIKEDLTTLGMKDLTIKTTELSTGDEATKRVKTEAREAPREGSITETVIDTVDIVLLCFLYAFKIVWEIFLMNFKNMYKYKLKVD